MSNDFPDDRLAQARLAIKAGRRNEARQLLQAILKENPQNEEAWLWLSGAVETPELKIQCLRKVVSLNPGNAAARRGLAQLTSQTTLHLPASTPSPAPIQATTPSLLVKTEEPVSPSYHRPVFMVLGGIFLVICLIGLVVLLWPNLPFVRENQLVREPAAIAGSLDGASTITPTLSVASNPEPTPIPTQITPTLPFRPGDPTATPPGSEITDPDYLRGKEAYEATDYEAVLRYMTLVLSRDPNLASPYWYRGMAYYYLGDYQAGLKEMEQALALDPDYALAYADTGLLYSVMGDEVKAIPYWQKALELDPSLAKVHNNMGYMYAQQGDVVKALSEYDLALAIDPNRSNTWSNRAALLLDMGDYQECVSSATNAINLKPEAFWPNYYHRGTCYANLGEYQLALNDFDIYLTEVQDDPEGWYNRGIVHRGLGHLNESVADYTRAIELQPDFAWAYINRGNAYSDLQEHQLALQDYETALTFGSIPLAHFGQGNALRSLGRLEESVLAYQTAIDIWPVAGPSLGDVYGQLADSYLSLQEYQLALNAADTALTLGSEGGNEPLMLEIRGRAHYGLGHYEEAVADLELSFTQYPSGLTLYYRGLAYQAAGDIERAKGDLAQFYTWAIANGNYPDELADARARLDVLQGN